MSVENQRAESTKPKRRFRYLWRRDSKLQQKEDQGSKMPYQFPDISTMSPEEVDKEITLRVRSLQRRGAMECTDPTVLSNVIPLPAVKASKEIKKAAVQPPKSEKIVDRPTFKPRLFVKRRISGSGK